MRFANALKPLKKNTITSQIINKTKLSNRCLYRRHRHKNKSGFLLGDNATVPIFVHNALFVHYQTAPYILVENILFSLVLKKYPIARSPRVLSLIYVRVSLNISDSTRLGKGLRFTKHAIRLPLTN